MDPLTRKLVETYTQMSEGILDSLYSEQKPTGNSWIGGKPPKGQENDWELVDRDDKIIGLGYEPRHRWRRKKQQTPQPTPGKTPYHDRAGDTSIDAANDPARGGQSGAWGGGAGTPAPKPKPPTFGQHSMEDFIRPATPRKPSPYDKIL